MASAQPHETGVAVYPALFELRAILYYCPRCAFCRVTSNPVTGKNMMACWKVMEKKEKEKEKEKEQGRIHGKTVADSWAGAVMQKPLPIQKCDGRMDQ